MLRLAGGGWSGRPVRAHRFAEAPFMVMSQFGAKKESQGDGVYESIRLAILEGRYEPGQRLIEARLAQEFAVSRTRVRDSLTRLEAEHLVSPAPNRGVVVRSFSSSDIQELYELRLLLEGYAAGSAAKNITTEEIRRITEVQERMEELERSTHDAPDRDARLSKVWAITEVNNEFHRLIQEAARNSRLRATLRNVVDVPLVFRSFYWYSDEELAEAALEHRGIIQALVEHDQERATELMRKHVVRGMNTLLREL